MNLQIYEEATEWLLMHRDGALDAGEKRAFDTWLRESPQHVRAYLEISSVWEDVPSLPPGWNPDAQELINCARTNTNVVPLSPTSGDSRGMASKRRAAPEPQRHQVPKKLLYALVASILVVFASAWVYLQRNVYATDLGEQRSLVLADGSIVNLNSHSRIRIQYSEHERHVNLLKGQAFFRVAKNPARPFIVQTGETQVRAVGTAFDVYKKRSGTVVTVVEGRVAVLTSGRASSQPLQQSADTASPAHTSVSTGARVVPPSVTINSNGNEVILASGEQLTVTPTALEPPKRANVAAATAWTHRSLVFESSPLTEVAGEFNRYNERPLRIEDPELADFHVSGVFSSVEPTLLLRFLRAQPELIVQETDTEIRISKK